MLVINKYTTIILLCFDVLLFIIIFDRMPVVLSITQILLGLPLWFWCIERAFREQKRVGWLWLLISAPLIRQMFWVILPVILFYTAPFRDFLPLLNLLSNNNDITHGAIIMTIGNYVMFLSLYWGIKFINISRLPVHVFDYRSPNYLFIIGLLLIFTWTYFRVEDITSELLQIESNYGSSVTAGWGYVAQSMILLFFLPRRDASLSRKHILIWVIATIVFVIPFLTIGQRMHILYPFVVLTCLYTVCKTSININFTKLILLIVCALVSVIFVFFISDNVRSKYFWTGYHAPISEVIQMPTLPIAMALTEVNTRFNSPLIVNELVSERPDLFPQRNLLNLAASFIVPFDNRYIKISEVLKIDNDMNSMPPGKYLMTSVLEGESTASWPPETEFFLDAGYVGVFIGWSLIGLIYCAWIQLLLRLKLHPSIFMSIILGCLFTELILAELATRFIAVITFRLAVLVVFLLGVKYLSKLFFYSSGEKMIASKGRF